MKELKLSRGKVAQVSDEDYERASKQKWSALHTQDGDWYAVCEMEGKYTYLHRYLMDAKPGERIDHKDRNGLNCQRENMRLATPSQNNMNRERQANNLSSKYKGVRLYKNSGRWGAQIQNKSGQIYLGLYSTEDEAGAAYNHAAREYFGEFACYNDVPNWQNIYPVPLKLNSANTSGFRGVSWSKVGKMWTADIRKGGIRERLGYFKNKTDAALAYDEIGRAHV